MEKPPAKDTFLAGCYEEYDAYLKVERGESLAASKGNQ